MGFYGIACLILFGAEFILRTGETFGTQREDVSFVRGSVITRSHGTNTGQKFGADQVVVLRPGLTARVCCTSVSLMRCQSRLCCKVPRAARVLTFRCCSVFVRYREYALSVVQLSPRWGKRTCHAD